jgi:hypothetical protein
VKPKARKGEHASQNDMRNALAGEAFLFRANVGQGWTGNRVKHLPTGAVLIEDPRPFSTGLPTGFADLFGFVPVVITRDMVGMTVAIFVAAEVKSTNGKRRDAQIRFIAAVQNNGGRAGFARTVDEARDIIQGKGSKCERQNLRVDAHESNSKAAPDAATESALFAPLSNEQTR